MRVGCACVSNADQNPGQASCEEIFRDFTSGSVDSRKGLAEPMEYARDGWLGAIFYRPGRFAISREDLQNKASRLNLVVAAIILWNTVHLEEAVAALERKGTAVPAECLPHLSTLGW